MQYRGSPTYTKIPNTVSSITVFGFVRASVSRGPPTVPLTPILRDMVFSKFQNAHNTLAKAEIIYPKNVGALVAMNFKYRISLNNVLP